MHSSVHFLFVLEAADTNEEEAEANCSDNRKRRVGEDGEEKVREEAEEVGGSLEDSLVSVEGRHHAKRRLNQQGLLGKSGIKQQQ